MAEEFEVELSTQADADLTGILHFHYQSGGLESASKINTQVQDTIAQIIKMPLAKPIYAPLANRFRRTYRFAFVGKAYRIVYHVVAEPKLIIINRITWVRADPGLIYQSLEQE